MLGVSEVVSKRYGGEYNNLQEFITPSAYAVRQLANYISGGSNFALDCLRWVVGTVSYPSGSVDVMDRHYQEAFVSKASLLGGIKPVLSSTQYDFWQFPFETIAAKMGDCEDSAFLLASLLRTRISEDDVFAAIGQYQTNQGSFGHAWVVHNGLVYETTLSKAEPIPEEGSSYIAYVKFNDKRIMWLGR